MFRFLAITFSLLLLLAIAGAGGALYLLWHFGRDLPDYQQLAHYEPPVTTRVYAGDGRLVAEYASEKRTFVPISAMPQRVTNAFMSAEDKNFYRHPGVDWTGIARAVIVNLRNLGGDRRPVGASTITQQVAKNFLLTNEVSLDRKIKEALLAFRIERAFSKDHILELYLNEIYLGFGSYGVAAAAMNYFNKSLDELTIAETAFLAALPKAPNNYNPLRNPQAAVERRNWVIGRMFDDGHITRAEAEAAMREPLALRRRAETEVVREGDYFAEDIRRELAARFGERVLYEGGLSVRSTMDPRLQAIATRALREGLMDYDRRHGWRGPVTRIEISGGWPQRLSEVARPRGALPSWETAVVLSTDAKGAEIGLRGGTRALIPFSEMNWARPWLEGQRVGRAPRSAADVVQPGDVILVEAVRKGLDGKDLPEGSYTLRQIPDVEGALVAMDPHTGRVLAMAGGFSFQRSQFNRATQALRQPGSAFKPLVYLTALDKGFSPSSLVLDGPISLSQGPGLPLWTPSNYSRDFLGPTTLRVGMEKSRNLMTVRLAEAVGMDDIAEYAEKFGVTDRLPKVLSMSLGAGETTVLRLTSAYAMMVNGGKRITPTLIDRIQDRQGRSVYRHDQRDCEGCLSEHYTNQGMPHLPDTREQLADPRSAYQMVSILEGVVLRGTGRRIAELGRPIAGKTGTSNNVHDTWFVGFSPDLAVGVFVGFDEPRTLGSRETGGTVAAPIFKDFMAEALKDQPATPFRVPPGIRLVRVNADTGRPAQPGDRNVIWEAFKPENVPTADMSPSVLGGDVFPSFDNYGYGLDVLPAPTEGGFSVEISPAAPSEGVPMVSQPQPDFQQPQAPPQPAGIYTQQPVPGGPSGGYAWPAPAASPPPVAVPEAGGLY
ncbi:penicillin-binding protein 1A [Telmatospirillum sp. J64-1]|uniref:penicillin-binding protein 1A n=1 Tax=Telmatospirillum sp. J64-1 TaxID=2502183 RepID=UPI00115D1E94|nr:penicillin-binding protein 1A [Telmatospirillum sp. J64-1]